MTVILVLTSAYACGLQGYCTSTRPSSRVVARNGAATYAQTFARVPIRKSGRNPAADCAMRSVLFVKNSADKEYKIVFMQAPTEESPGTSLEPVDWSPSGQYLLAKLVTYQFEGEGANRTFIIYDADSGLVYSPDMLSLFKQHYGKACAAEAAAVGFTPDGRVVIAVNPIIPDETYEPLYTLPNCVQRKKVLGLDFRKGKLDLLGSSYHVQRYSVEQPLK